MWPNYIMSVHPITSRLMEWLNDVNAHTMNLVHKLITKSTIQKCQKLGQVGAWPRSREQRSVFTARYYASAVLAVVMCLSVCPSVTSRSCTTMAQARITLTTPYVSSWTPVFRCQKSWQNSNQITPNGGAKYRWVGSHRRFSTNISLYQKRCKIGTQLLWKANRNSCALCRMALFSMTLGDT